MREDFKLGHYQQVSRQHSAVSRQHSAKTLRRAVEPGEVCRGSPRRSPLPALVTRCNAARRKSHAKATEAADYCLLLLHFHLETLDSAHHDVLADADPRRGVRVP